MKKHGFTLVELLAVIAILAILVIIALPNVMGMFNSAKKNLFETEIKEIVNVANSDYIKDALNSSGKRIYIKCNSENCNKELDMSSRDKLEYYVEIDSNGKIVKLYAIDGSYQYKYEGTGLNKNQIKDIQSLGEISEDEKLVITCSGINNPSNSYSGPIYVYNERGTVYNDREISTEKREVWCHINYAGNACSLGSYYETEEQCISSIGSVTSTNYCQKNTMYFDENIQSYFREPVNHSMPYYLKFQIVDNYVSESFLCFKTDRDYCLKELNNNEGYLNNVSILINNQSYFENCSENETEYSCQGGSEYLRYIDIYKDGNLSLGNKYGAGCLINKSGHAYCYD